MVLPDSDPLPRDGPYSGYRAARVSFAYGAFTLFGRTFQTVLLKTWDPLMRSYNPTGVSLWFGLVRFRSPLLTESRFLSFPPGTEMFQFPGLARGFRDQRSLTAPPDLSQSSTPFCLLAPRHPPHALTSLAASLTPSSKAFASREACDRPPYTSGREGKDFWLASQARVVPQTVPALWMTHCVAHPLCLPGLLDALSCLPVCQTSTPIISPLPGPLLGIFSLCRRLQGAYFFFDISCCRCGNLRRPDPRCQAPENNFFSTPSKSLHLRHLHTFMQ